MINSYKIALSLSYLLFYIKGSKVTPGLPYGFIQNQNSQIWFFEKAHGFTKLSQFFWFLFGFLTERLVL